MARVYSFIVQSPDVIGFETYKVLLDEGRNVFNVILDDVQAFRLALHEKGVRVLESHDLNSDYEKHVPPDWIQDDVIDSAITPSVRMSSRTSRGGWP